MLILSQFDAFATAIKPEKGVKLLGIHIDEILEISTHTRIHF